MPPSTRPADASHESPAAIAQLCRLFEHMAWADLRVLELLESAPRARQQSVERVYSHLLAAERVWLMRLRGEDSSQQPIWPHFELSEMRALGERMAGAYRDLVASLGEDRLSEEVSYANSRGVIFRSTVADILTHVAMHGSYHRGQIAAAVRGAGAEPVNTDFITYARETG
jgi:uncharacterized damage-inducible protein DinB